MASKENLEKEEIPNSDLEAINKFSFWINSFLEDDIKIDSLKVIHSRLIQWDEGKKNKVFLLEYTRSNGTIGVGFTGPFTWNFSNINLEDYNTVPKKHRFSRLINLYFGWYYAFNSISLPANEIQLLSKSMRNAIGKKFEKEYSSCRFDLTDSFVISGAKCLIFKVSNGETKMALLPENLYIEFENEQVTFLQRFTLRRELFKKLSSYHVLGTKMGPIEIVNGFGLEFAR